MPKKRIHKDRSTNIRPKTRNRVECNFMLHCNGSKWVDPRTFEKHRQEMECFRTITSAHQSTSQFRSSIRSLVDVGSSSTSKRRRKQEEEEEEDQDSLNSSYFNGDESNQTDYQEPINIPTKQKRYPKFRQTELIPDDENLNNDSDDNDGSDDNGGGSDDNGGGSDDNDGLNDNGDDNEDFDNNESYTEDDDRGFSDDDVPIEQFTAPNFDDFDFESDDEYPDANIEFNDSWILLWILKYQARFRLPDVAINSLIKFFQIVLSDADNERFKNFPTSSYMMRKMLEFGKHSKRYAVCPSCNKLYKESEILSTSGFKCNNVEFPNHPRRNPCGAE